MKASKLLMLLTAVGFGAGLQTATALTTAQLSLRGGAGLVVTGALGTVYAIQYTTNLAQPDAWQCLSLLTLPASPYLAPGTAPSTRGCGYYRVVAMARTNMVFIPPGTFLMGSPTSEVDRYFDEGPQTAVTISQGFWMSVHLVTQGEYQSVTTNNPSYFAGNPTNPVEQVDWSDATNYCALLTQRDLASGQIPFGFQYRLPTEAEWEYACRAGTTTRFYYGDDPGYTNLASYAWYSGNSGGQTHPVGLKPPNPWGLYDMCGNVWEWCQDWYGPYPGGSVTDPQGPATGLLRVLRGGSWDDLASYARSACRWEDLPASGSYYPYYGFRVVLAPSGR